MSLPLPAGLTAFAHYTFSLELILGGTFRLFPSLFPRATKKARAKSEGYKTYLPFIPGRTAEDHTWNIGFMMFLSGWCMALPLVQGLGLKLPIGADYLGWITRGGTGLGTGLAMMGVYSQYRMGVPFWLPCVNTLLGTISLLGLAA